MMNETWSKLATFSAAVMVNGAIIAGMGCAFNLEMKPREIRTTAYNGRQQCGCGRNENDRCGDAARFPNLRRQL